MVQNGLGLVIVVLFIVVACASADVGLVPFFHGVVNTSSHSHGVAAFVKNLSSAIGAPPRTLLVINATNITVDQWNEILPDVFCPHHASSNTSNGTTSNVTTELDDVQVINFTFIGSLSGALNATRSLDAMSVVTACTLGILTLNRTYPAAAPVQPVVAFSVTLQEGVTPEAFVDKLAAMLGVTPDVFSIGNSSSNATSARMFASQSASGATFILVVTGVNPGAIQDRVLSLSAAQLFELGALDLVPESPTPTPSTTSPSPTPQPTPTSPTADDGDSKGVIIGCSVGGAALLIVGLVVLHKMRKGTPAVQHMAHEMNKEQQEVPMSSDFHSGNNNASAELVDTVPVATPLRLPRLVEPPPYARRTRSSMEATVLDCL